MCVKVHIEDTNEQFECSSGESLLSSMARLGRKGIPIGCQGGGCGICKVEIIKGQVAKKIMSKAHVSSDDELNGRLLACRCIPLTDVSVKVIGHMKKNVCKTKQAIKTI